MKKVKDILKTVFLSICVLYTIFGIAAQTIKPAAAFDTWDLQNMIDDIVSKKISAYDYNFKRSVTSVVESCYMDYDFKRAVRSVIESCTVDDDTIYCY